MSFFDKLKAGLQKTKESIFSQVNSIFKAFVKVDEEMLEELEEILIASDVGVSITEEFPNRKKQDLRLWKSLKNLSVKTKV